MKGEPSKKLLLLLLLTRLFLVPSPAQGLSLEEIYPRIESLLPGDPNLKQLQQDIAYYYRQAHSRRELPPLGIYLYQVTDSDTLFGLAARFNLPYESLATLNHLSRKEDLSAGQTLMVPSMPGLFLPSPPTGELERFLRSWREMPAKEEAYHFLTPRGEEEFLFLPGERFHQIERAFFLGILFRSPLPAGKLSSDYGWRISPITGNEHFHNGIDLAAPRGTEVFPAREGSVIAVGRDSVYGNYIALSHEGGYSTFYGHLDSTSVELNQTVTSTMIIGRVGDTGLSTGPHLHFELRNPNGSFDPESFLPGVER